MTDTFAVPADLTSTTIPRITAKKVLDVLVDRKIFDDVSLVTLLGETRHHLSLLDLERALMRDARVSDSVLVSVKSSVSGYPAIPSHDVRPVALISKELAWSSGAIVTSESPLTVTLVEDLPDSISALSVALSSDFAITVCTISRFAELYAACYEGKGHVDRPNLGEIYDILDQGIRLGASDIHLSTGVAPTLRVDGSLLALPFQNVDAQWLRNSVSLIGGVKRLEQVETGYDVDMALSYGNTRFRVNFGMENHGLTIAARKIPSKIPTAEDLGLPIAVRDLGLLERGLVLVTGPTGSGKSTTLATLLSTICRDQRKHIITLEDPIEFILPQGKSMVHQREFGSSFTSFASGLRQSLRQDPDVILVGEMRDIETIRTALTAAETGHLVFGTLHSVNSASTLTRIVSAFPADEQEQVRALLGYTMKAIVSQALLPNISGKGRSAAFEVLIVTPAVANNLRRIDGQASIHQIMETSRADGMQTLDMALVDLVKRRVISEEAALEKAGDREDFLKRLKN